LGEIAAVQAYGTSLTEALKAAEIPASNYHKWVNKAGKPVPTAVPVAKKSTAKPALITKAKSTRVRYTPEQKDEMCARDKALKVEGKTDKEVAKILGIAVPTLYKMRKDVKAAKVKTRGRAAAKLQIQLSADNPMYQLAVAHERLMAVNKQIGALTAERDMLTGKMRGLMEKASEVWPEMKVKK
jgi:DNA-binding CsgD family transcriptional regulator